LIKIQEVMHMSGDKEYTRSSTKS